MNETNGWHQTEILSFSDLETQIIAKAKTYSELFRESAELSRLADEAEFNTKICDSVAHTIHMNAAVSSFKAENIGEMGFQTFNDSNEDTDWKQIEKDAEWAKLQVGLAEAEHKRVCLDSERVEQRMKNAERDLLKFLRNLPESI